MLEVVGAVGGDGMKGKVLTEANLKFVKLLSRGKYLKGSFSSESREKLAKLGFSDPNGHCSKLEEMGIIVGYVPVFSEEGKRILAGAEAMYGLQSKDKTAGTATEDVLSEFRT